MLEPAVFEHEATFGKQFKAAAMDRSYYDANRIDELESTFEIDLAIPHKKDRNQRFNKKKHRLYDKRSAIESKISEGKRMVGLDKCYYRGFTGDRIWTSLAVLSLNIRKLLRDLEKRPKLIRSLAFQY